VVLGPGLYPRLEDVAIRNKDMSSLQTVDQEPTVSADPVAAHIILFEHAQFRGSHEHVFQKLDNLGAGDDNSFDNITSSIVVLAGTWWTFGEASQQRQFKTFLGPGLYPRLDGVNIPNDDVSSLEPSDSPPSVVGQQKLGEAVLFEHAVFRGAHRHIFNAESDLNDSEDDSFNDATSSIAVLQNVWWIFRDSGFFRAYDVNLGQGLFPGVEQVGIANNDLSSLEVAGLRLTLSGTVTVKINSGTFPDPIVHSVDMTLIFHTDSEVLEIERGFASFDLPFTIDGVTPTVAYGGAAGGNLHLADGSASISAVTIDISAGLSLSLTFALTTGQAISPTNVFMPTGVPFVQDANTAKIKGTITLVGAGRQNDDDYQIVIEGSLAEI
jgi:hypothetical protein